MTERASGLKLAIKYVGPVKNILPENKCRVNFLKFYDNRKYKFSFSDVKHTNVNFKEQIIAVLNFFKIEGNDATLLNYICYE